jgi:hypothetical protein
MNMARINYIYLFEFDPRNIDTPMDIFNDAVDETLVFLLLMLIYYKVRFRVPFTCLPFQVYDVSI